MPQEGVGAGEFSVYSSGASSHECIENRWGYHLSLSSVMEPPIETGWFRGQSLLLQNVHGVMSKETKEEKVLEKQNKK